MLAYQMAYMFGKISCHSPFLHLSGTRLCHAEEEEEEGVVGRPPFSTLWSSARYNCIYLQIHTQKKPTQYNVPVNGLIYITRPIPVNFEERSFSI